MSKSILKNYLEYGKRSRNKKHFDFLSTGCFKLGDEFLISDSYSVVVLKDSKGLEIKEDLLGISNHYHNMSSKDEVIGVIGVGIIQESKEDSIPLGVDNYEIGVKIANRIIKLIKCNLIEIMGGGYTPIIRLTNTKTKERAYLLPMRKY